MAKKGSKKSLKSVKKLAGTKNLRCIGSHQA
jgi:hypothetical protein